jgi:hypothetical protein
MKKRLSEDAMILLFSAGVLGATFIIGLVVLYGFDKIF